ncbi:MAG TPA: hypothetical protein VGE59_01340 [Patescibacteria group bacterium]
MKAHNQKFLASCLATLVILLPILVWGSSLPRPLSQVSLYELFPVFGLLAFSIFWLQLLGLLCKPYLTHLSLRPFFKWSSHAFMTFVIAHPLLLAIAQFNNHLGLPLQSFYDYVPSNLTGYINLAVIAFLVFVITEITGWIGNTPWIQKFAKPLEYVNYLTFFLVFWHSIHLGQHLQSGWLLTVWWFFVITGLPIITTLIIRDIKK